VIVAIGAANYLSWMSPSATRRFFDSIDPERTFVSTANSVPWHLQCAVWRLKPTDLGACSAARAIASMLICTWASVGAKFGTCASLSDLTPSAATPARAHGG